MVLSVTVAETDAERSAVGRLRYEIYCEQQHFMRDLADHERRVLLDDVDDRSIVLQAHAKGELVGTMRLVPGPIARQQTAKVAAYSLDLLDDVVPPDDYMVVDRFMIVDRYRRGALTRRLMLEAAGRGLGLGATIGFCDCEPHLVNLYRSFGFCAYKGLANLPGLGLRVPLVLIADRSHLCALGSPIGEMFSASSPVGRSAPELLAAFGTRPGAVPLADVGLDGLPELSAAGGESSVLAGLSPGDLAAVTDRAHVMTLEPGHELICQNHTSRTVYVVLSGMLDVIQGGDVIARARPGDVVGEIALLRGTQRTSDVTAASEATVLALDQHQLSKIIRGDTALSARLLRNFASVLSEKLMRVSHNA